jgi:hypothetical protein
MRWPGEWGGNAEYRPDEEKKMGVIRTVVCVVACAGIFSAWPVGAAGAVQAAAQGECAAMNTARGEGKFTGQITGTPMANGFEVVAGNQSATVSYGGGVLVCEDGQAVSTSALVAGASVVVFGPMKGQGNRFELTATRILVAGRPRGNLRGTAAEMATTSAGPGTNPAGEQNRTSISMGGEQNRPGASSLPGTIACSALEFSVSGARDLGGRPMGRASTSPIVCRKAADQAAVQLVEEVATGRRIANIALSWQNQVIVKLADAEVTSVQFKVDNGAQIVEVTFASQKVEIEHPASGTRVLLQ